MTRTFYTYGVIYPFDLGHFWDWPWKLRAMGNSFSQTHNDSVLNCVLRNFDQTWNQVCSKSSNLVNSISWNREYIVYLTWRSRYSSNTRRNATITWKLKAPFNDHSATIPSPLYYVHLSECYTHNNHILIKDYSNNYLKRDKNEII